MEKDQPMYHFSMIARYSNETPVDGESLMDLAEELGNRNATDIAVAGHANGVLLEADRTAASLSAAIASAIEDAHSVGLAIQRIEIENDDVETAA